jgi:hypothetical protein
MKIHDCEQGSSEWVALHIGRPSVSKLNRILTSARLEYSKGARAYASELIAERMLGRPLDWGAEYDGTIWTDRGTSMEDEARRWYAFYKDVEVQEVGFITNDEETFGGSPDGLVGDVGLVEIKCRGAKAHARCMTGADEIADRLQTQGYLWLTGRAWVDVIAYNPDLPKKIVRQYPEDKVQEMIGRQLTRFLAEMERAERRLRDLGDVIEEDEDIKWTLIESLKESLKEGAPA